MKDNELIQEALKQWGKETQLDMVIEECAELIQAIQKYRRGLGQAGTPMADVIEEGVDVELCLEQLKVITAEPVLWNHYRTLKLNRLARKLGVSHEG